MTTARGVSASHLNQRHRKLSKSATASRVTNGSALLPDTDGRSRWIRRVKDLIDAHTRDLANNISFSEHQLIHRCAVLITELEYREMNFAQAGHATDDQLAVYQTTTNTLRRLLETLGLQRRAKTIPTMDEFLRQRGHLSGDHHHNNTDDADIDALAYEEHLCPSAPREVDPS